MIGVNECSRERCAHYKHERAKVNAGVEDATNIKRLFSVLCSRIFR